jgi:hypothetical protein
MQRVRARLTVPITGKHCVHQRAPNPVWYAFAAQRLQPATAPRSW